MILPDDMVQHQTGCLAQMAAQYETVGGNLVAVENVPSEETYRYGVLNPGAETGDLVEVKSSSPCSLQSCQIARVLGEPSSSIVARVLTKGRFKNSPTALLTVFIYRSQLFFIHSWTVVP